MLHWWLMLDSRVVDLRMFEFIPIKPVVAQVLLKRA
jgi:hypothetical protein